MNFLRNKNAILYTLNSNTTNQFVGVADVRAVYGGTRIIADLPTEWSDDMHAAFHYACELWEEVLPTSFPIRIKVKMKSNPENLSEGAVLSKVTTARTYTESPSLYSLRPQIKATMFMQMAGIYDPVFFYDVFDVTCFNEPDIVITYNEYADMKLYDFGLQKIAL